MAAKLAENHNINRGLCGRGGLRAVLFDCDGVIANSEEVMFAAGYEFVRAHGLPLSKREFAGISIGGTGPRSYMPVLEALYQETHGTRAPLDFGRRYCAQIYGALDKNLTEVPGVQEVLQDLAERAVPRAVGTNAGTAGTHYKLQNLGLSGYFNHHVYSFGPAARPKPAPDIYQQAAAGLGFAARDCVVIDDSPTGVKAGIAAGALVIGYAGGAHRDADYGADLRGAGAHLVARNMAEVGAILRRTVRGVSL